MGPRDMVDGRQHVLPEQAHFTAGRERYGLAHSVLWHRGEMGNGLWPAEFPPAGVTTRSAALAIQPMGM